jgi:hypothetical protein
MPSTMARMKKAILSASTARSQDGSRCPAAPLATIGPFTGLVPFQRGRLWRQAIVASTAKCRGLKLTIASRGLQAAPQRVASRSTAPTHRRAPSTTPMTQREAPFLDLALGVRVQARQSDLTLSTKRRRDGHLEYSERSTPRARRCRRSPRERPEAKGAGSRRPHGQCGRGRTGKAATAAGGSCCQQQARELAGQGGTQIAPDQ